MSLFSSQRVLIRLHPNVILGSLLSETYCSYVFKMILWMYCSSELIKTCRLIGIFYSFFYLLMLEICLCKDVWYILGLNYCSFMCSKRDASELIVLIAELILSVLFYFDVSK